jgi:hypothetical protein
MLGLFCGNVQGANVLLNGSFDDFSITSAGYNAAYDAGSNPNGYTDSFAFDAIRLYKDSAAGIGWKTTATDSKIEIWQSRAQGVPSADGIQFTEINADEVAALYQDTVITGGGNFSDGNAAWGNYAVANAFTSVVGGAYRFSFGAVSTSGGNASQGNFFDNVNFGVNFVPEPSAALLGLLGALAMLRRR